MSSSPFIEGFSPGRTLLVLVARYAVCVVLAASFGCGRPFNVKTQPEMPAASDAVSVSAGKVTVGARAITDEDYLYDSFDANLILAGVLPVRVTLSNSGSESVDLKNTGFELRATQGRIHKAINARRAFKRMMSYYEITLSGKTGYTESLDEFSAFALDTKTPLAAGQSRKGLVFFSTGSETARGAGLTMVVSGLDAAISGSRGRLELKLN